MSTGVMMRGHSDVRDNDRLWAASFATALRDLLDEYGGDWARVPEIDRGPYWRYDAAAITAELARLDAMTSGKTLTDDDDAMMFGGHRPGYGNAPGEQQHGAHGHWTAGQSMPAAHGEGEHAGAGGAHTGGGGGEEHPHKGAPSIEQIKARIGAGVRTEGDAIAVGDMVRARIHENMGRYYTEVARTAGELHEANQRYLEVANSGREPNGAPIEHAERAHAAALEAYDGMLRHETAHVLGQIRDVGGEKALLTTWHGEDTIEHLADLRAIDAVRVASESMPTDWIRASNDFAARDAAMRGAADYAGPHGIYVMAGEARPGYAGSYTVPEGSGAGRITMRAGADAREAQTTAAHELGHRFEHAVPGISEMERAFYDRRTAGELMQPFSPQHATIAIKPDRFADRYIGAVPLRGRRADGTTQHYYEILSRGLEWTFGRSYGSRTLFLQDPEYHAFILGLLAGA